MLLHDMILQYNRPCPQDSFYQGCTLPDGFELPDNILVFMHDWFPPQHYAHSRYILIIPAVPIEYLVDNNILYKLKEGQALFSLPCQKRELQMTSGDLAHGYPRLMITFNLAAPLYYLPENMLLDITSEAERHLSSVLEAYKQGHNEDLSIQLFFLLRELSSHRASVQPIEYSREVKRTLGYINNHSGSEASLEKLAAYAKTSISNLRTLFKKEMGISPGAFVAAHRLKVAQYNLAMTSIRVDELA